MARFIELTHMGQVPSFRVLLSYVEAFNVGFEGGQTLPRFGDGFGERGAEDGRFGLKLAGLATGGRSSMLARPTAFLVPSATSEGEHLADGLQLGPGAPSRIVGFLECGAGGTRVA